MFKFLMYWFKLKRISTYEDLAYSVEHFPYRHISIGQGTQITKGSLKNHSKIEDFEIYVDGKTLNGHVMTIEHVRVENKTCYIHHLSLHPNFRKHKLGKPCVYGLLKLLKYEKDINTMVFEERLWERDYYQIFFNQTLGLKKENEEPDIWMLQD